MRSSRDEDAAGVLREGIITGHHTRSCSMLQLTTAIFKLRDSLKQVPLTSLDEQADLAEVAEAVRLSCV